MGIGDGGKIDGNGNKVGGQATAFRAMVRATVMDGEAHPDGNVRRLGL